MQLQVAPTTRAVYTSGLLYCPQKSSSMACVLGRLNEPAAQEQENATPGRAHNRNRQSTFILGSFFIYYLRFTKLTVLRGKVTSNPIICERMLAMQLATQLCESVSIPNQLWIYFPPRNRSPIINIKVMARNRWLELKLPVHMCSCYDKVNIKVMARNRWLELKLPVHMCSCYDKVFRCCWLLVSVSDPKPTSAWNAFSITRGKKRLACYTGSDIRAGWGLGTRLPVICPDLLLSQ